MILQPSVLLGFSAGFGLLWYFFNDAFLSKSHWWYLGEGESRRSIWSGRFCVIVSILYNIIAECDWNMLSHNVLKLILSDCSHILQVVPNLVGGGHGGGIVFWSGERLSPMYFSSDFVQLSCMQTFTHILHVDSVWMMSVLLFCFFFSPYSGHLNKSSLEHQN